MTKSVDNKPELTQCRKAFEEWMLAKRIDTTMSSDRWSRPIYKHSHVQAMWESWACCWDNRAVPITPEQAREALDNLHRFEQGSEGGSAELMAKAQDAIRKALEYFAEHERRNDATRKEKDND